MAKHSKQPPAAPTAPEKQIGTEIGEQIGRRLKAMFDQVVAEPVPERFQRLIEELERRSRNP